MARKMIYTASFDIARHHPRVNDEGLRMWSIAYKHPVGWDGKNVCLNFMPLQFMEDQLRNGQLTEQGYEMRFRECILDHASPSWLYDYYKGVLCCHEPFGQWCHRHIVAKWFNEHGFPVLELGFEDKGTVYRGTASPEPVKEPEIVKPVKMKQVSLFE